MLHCLRFILFMTFFLTSTSSWSQLTKDQVDSTYYQHNRDSIKTIIAHTPDDTLKVIRLLTVSGLRITFKTASSDYALQALALAEKLHYKQGIALAYRELGAISQDAKDYATAIKYFRLGLDLSETVSYTSESTEFFAPLLNLYFYLGDYPNAMETISREKVMAEKMNDKNRIAHCNNILGYIYFKQENFSEAEKYYDNYLSNAKELNDSILMAHALGEMSDVYIQEKKYEQAIKVLFNCIQICDAILQHPDQHYFVARTPQYKAKAFYRIGMAYKLQGDLPHALQFSLDAIKNGSRNPGYDTAAFYINAGDVYKDLKDFGKAIQYLWHGYVLSVAMHHRENTRDAAEYLSQTYALQSRYDSAFYYYQLFTGLKDSIVNNETKMKIAGIQGQYDVAKKDKEIARQHQIRNILIGSFGFLLIVLLLLYNGYRLRQKNRYQREYNRQQNELFNAIVSTQDQERKRIAQDIHDSLGSVLSAAKLKLSSLEENKASLSSDQLEKYQSTLTLLDEASSELRSISHNIMPATLSKLGLVAALQNLIGKISGRSGLQISLTAHELEGRIEENTEISIYRIILELINNIVKHAKADKVSIQLVKYPEYINVIVEDNGQGFDYQKAMEEKKGIGLGNVLSRVEYLKGTVDIDSAPGKGTTVVIEIPYRV